MTIKSFRKQEPRYKMITRQTRITVDGQNSIMKYCASCQMETPHKVGDRGASCGVCGKMEKRKKE